MMMPSTAGARCLGIREIFRIIMILASEQIDSNVLGSEVVVGIRANVVNMLMRTSRFFREMLLYTFSLRGDRVLAVLSFSFSAELPIVVHDRRLQFDANSLDFVHRCTVYLRIHLTDAWHSSGFFHIFWTNRGMWFLRDLRVFSLSIIGDQLPVLTDCCRRIFHNVDPYEMLDFFRSVYNRLVILEFRGVTVRCSCMADQTTRGIIRPLSNAAHLARLTLDLHGPGFYQQVRQSNFLTSLPPMVIIRRFMMRPALGQPPRPPMWLGYTQLQSLVLVDSSSIPQFSGHLRELTLINPSGDLSDRDQWFTCVRNLHDHSRLSMIPREIRINLVFCFLWMNAVNLRTLLRDVETAVVNDGHEVLITFDVREYADEDAARRDGAMQCQAFPVPSESDEG